MRGGPQTIDLLVAAKTLLKASAWRRGSVDIHHHCHCAMTALLYVSSECRPTNVRPYTLAKLALASVVGADQIMRWGTLPEGRVANVIIDFNDAPGRTKAEVLWLYDMAMLLATGDFALHAIPTRKREMFLAWVDDVRERETGRPPARRFDQ